MTNTCGLGVLDDPQVLLPELVSRVVDVLAAQVGEALARRAADHDVGCGMASSACDVTPEGVALAEVGGVRAAACRFHSTASTGSNPSRTKPAVMPAAACEQVDQVGDT